MGLIRSLVILIIGLCVISFLKNKENKYTTLSIVKSNQLYILLIIICFVLLLF